MSLRGRIAIVSGASRGVGRGIALQLAQAGCTVYITGRPPSESLSASIALPTLENTALEISQRGGIGIVRYVDHGDMKSVEEFFKSIDEETGGRLDILINNAFSGVPYIIENLTKKFYESDPDLWDKFNNVGLRNHYFCAVLGARIMNKQGRGLIVNVGSPGGLYTLFNIPYGVGKCALDRMSKDMAQHLKDTKITVVSLWPGAVKTELIMNAVENSKNGLGLDNINTLFLNGESIEYSGKAVVSLALDPKVHTFAGKILFTADLGHKYKFKDIDGRNPPNMRSLRQVLLLCGHTQLAKFVPECLNCPGWLLAAKESTL